MKCAGCYKEGADGYCSGCRRKLFDGKKVSHVLSFDQPTADNLVEYHEKTKRLSISGVQLKYSLRLEKKELQLTVKGGQYILKPVPPGLIAFHDQAPENEHLTMQIAKQVFKIPVAENALIYFRDGSPAYITRRFDVNPDGTKQLQEDFAQLIGKSRQQDGENYKYEGSYEDIGQFIQSKVSAPIPVLESFFKQVLFNYIFSNGDAHLKNFSLIQTEFGDHVLSRAYDLMCTVLHAPSESDTALDLYEGDFESSRYRQFGCYGRPNFEELALRLGLLPSRSSRIINELLSKKDEVEKMIEHSFLDLSTQEQYLHFYQDKIRRFT
ncbi:MAG: HipA domain-containing protein [Chitinophagaceae bacterium]|jgi:serine/threonine-protein kinase HipA|nr:HipA domain-containing protein [Chitinophagaceae bacterium]